MSAVLTAEQALKLVGEMFVYHMPFNRALGMELERYEKEFAQLAFKNQPMMVGNWAQSILHGGVIASALDVAAGLVCVGSTLTRHETISEDELRQRLSRMGTIDLRVDYLRPGRGERFTAVIRVKTTTTNNSQQTPQYPCQQYHTGSRQHRQQNRMVCQRIPHALEPRQMTYVINVANT